MTGGLALLRKGSLSVDDVIAESKSMMQIIKSINKIVPFQVPVILQGEKGIGKSVLAKLIHKQSIFHF